jgi:zinc protease
MKHFLKPSGKTVFLFCLAVLTTPAFAQKAKGSFSVPFEKFVLENGLEVVLHEDHSDPIVALATLVHVGSNREKPGKTGFAHFFEHMSFNDSENTPQGANRKLIPEWGGTRNGGTWTDGTIYYEVVPKDAFDKILWIDSDRLGYMINTVTQQALEAEKQVVKNEKRQNVDNIPYGFTDEIILGNLYPPDHPYHWDVIGSLPDLQAATLADVKEFYNEYYGAGNATLVIAGDIDLKETKEKVTRWFGEIRKGPDIKPMKPRPVSLTETKMFSFEDNFARLPELRMVFPTVENYHADSYALDILAELLTGSKKSPLYKIIVEDKKLAPSVFASQNSNEIAGDFTLRVRGNAQSSLQDIKVAIDEAFQLFEKNEFTNDELAMVKAKQETALYQGIETLLNKAFTLAQGNEFAGNPAQITKAAELTQAVTREDIVRVYKKYIQGKNCIVTSVIPKGKSSLVVAGSQPAKVWQEQIISEVQNESVTRGGEADVPKTPSKYDRSEPPFGKVPLFKMPVIWESSLKNGLKILGIENTEVPLVSFDITVLGGHSFDPIEKAGTASLMGQLMMQGTKTRTSAELEEAIGLLGSSINIQTTNEETRISASCLAKNFEATVALVKEIMLEPRWDEAEFTRLKKALETNLKGSDANAATVASRNFIKLLYGKGSIYGLPVNGTLATVEKISLDDLKLFYSQYISPAQATVHISGAVTSTQATTVFNTLNSWTSKKIEAPSFAKPTSVAKGSVFFINIPEAKQSAIYVGRLALKATDPDFNNLDFANEVLGGGSSGRLTQTLRIEKGYTYGAGSFINQSKEIAPFIITTSVRSNATLPSLEIIKEMVKNYSNTFNEPEVAITKNKVLKNNTLAYESLGAKQGLLREISKYGSSKKFIEEDQTELTDMTVADFKKIINTYLNEGDMIYLIVGDKETQLAEVAKFNKDVKVLDLYGEEIK